MRKQHSQMFLPCLPYVGFLTVVAGMGIGNIEDIFEVLTLPGIIQQRNTL